MNNNHDLVYFDDAMLRLIKAEYLLQQINNIII